MADLKDNRPAPGTVMRPASNLMTAGGADVARDLLHRTDELAGNRYGWEQDWREIADFCLPSASREMMVGSMAGGSTYDRLVDSRPATRDASRRRFDSTAISAIDRLAAGIESLVSPSSEKWHEQAPNDPLAPEPTDEEAKWFEKLRDYQFNVRYSPLSGFANANQKYIRSIITMGTGVIFIEEAFGQHGVDQTRLPVLYSHLPISQCLIGVNAQGNPDTLHRRFSMSARQMAQKFGKDRLSMKVQACLDDVKRMDEKFEIVHAICPRVEVGSREAGTARKSPVASYYIEHEGAHLINNSGYFEFPFAIGYWIQPENSPYGESPAMAALDDIRSLNITRKSGLRSMQQWTDPPIAIAHDGIMNKPNLNPRAINFGAVDANGRLKIQPIITAQNPNLVQEIIKDQQDSVKELLYNNLFQILISNPQMTAHEAMLRAAEKGDLLGPNGVKIQQGYAAMSDREVGIMERKGAFRRGAALEAPASLAGRSFGARFTSQLDRIRGAKEGTAILQTYSAAGQIAQVRGNADIFDNLDDDEALKILASVNGMPQKAIVDRDKRDQARQAKAQAAQQAQQAQMAESMAKTAKDGGQGLSHMANAAATAQNGGMAPNVAPLQLPQLGPLDGGAA
jgi:hypothetical protein